MNQKYQQTADDVAMDDTIAYKWLAAETIVEALRDLRYTDTRNAELVWFGRRSMTPFGYGWCLDVCGVNPNLIRQKIQTAMLIPAIRRHADHKKEDKP